MSDDWRLRIHVNEEGKGHEMVDAVEAADLEQELAAAFPDRLVVSHDEDDAFCYTETREQAERAAATIRSVTAARGWHIETELTRWHPIAEQWEDPEQPLPSTEEQLAAERAERIERERREAHEQGYPDFEVRVHCRSRSDAVELSERLRAEGIPSVRRWHYVLIGAEDEDAASALAQRVAEESPAGAVVTTEGSGKAVNEVRPGNPFAVFGGLGG